MLPTFKVDKLYVLYPGDLDLKSIQRCPVDFEWEFIRLDDDILKEKQAVIYVRFQENCFVVHLFGREYKCNYNSRNLVMSGIHAYCVFGESPAFTEMVSRNFEQHLNHIIVRKNELPFLVFTNESISGIGSNNTIMEDYAAIDLQRFAEITKSKPCNHNFFVVYLGRKETPDGRYICCNVKTLETYEYSDKIRSKVEQMLINDIDGCIAKWKAEDELIELNKPAKRILDFHLLDFDGHPVEENTDYHLQMYDQPEEILKILDYRPVIYGTYRLNRADKIVVRYAIVDGIHYLTRENQFLQVHGSNDEIGFADEIPERDKRLEFHVTDNNTFRTVQWNKTIWLAFEKETFNYSSITFNEDDTIVRRGKRLELLLTKKQTDI